jgi:hypothetical protein
MQFPKEQRNSSSGKQAEKRNSSILEKFHMHALSAEKKK